MKKALKETDLGLWRPTLLYGSALKAVFPTAVAKGGTDILQRQSGRIRPACYITDRLHAVLQAHGSDQWPLRSDLCLGEATVGYF